MSLNANTLKNEIIADLDGLTDAEKADRDAMWLMICEKIIQHIQTYAVVSTTVSTTGTAAAQAGTGTGTIS
jgi:hypothetical protein